MDNFLIEGKSDDTYSLRKLLKYYAYLFVTSMFVSFLGSIIYITLLIQLYTTCNAQTGQQVAISQLISYILNGVFSYACLHLVSQSKTIFFVNFTVILTLISKIIALVFAAILKNRNWGECYITQAQGVMLITNISIEFCILLVLYYFTRNLYYRLEEKQLRVSLKLLFEQ
ncbi:unnamed protein product [Paramecium sonneborni]|uniref:Transmembrane protein n=1 Tax=Paramecium sonneborni TaxID=65129 RepID=A0A8S1RM12_9CILI|nr:unnamed protein product [Paramecium sonneborni]